MGGAVAAHGFAAEPSSQAISFVAASIIAPGFELLAAISIGLALRRRRDALFDLTDAILTAGARSERPRCGVGTRSMCCRQGLILVILTVQMEQKSTNYRV